MQLSTVIYFEISSQKDVLSIGDQFDRSLIRNEPIYTKQLLYESSNTNSSKMLWLKDFKSS